MSVFQQFRTRTLVPGTGGLVAVAGVVALLVVLPIATLAMVAAGGSGEVWPHLLAYVIPPALRDTAILLVGVGTLVVVVGTGAAWLVSAYDFAGRRVLQWALLLPLAIPTYIVAFTYSDVLHPIGPVQTLLRHLLGYTSPRQLSLPDIRSVPGCILVLGLVLYPYVYLPVRALFVMQAAGLIEAARMSGAGGARVFFRIALPLARPAIAAGVALALMEAVNDVGAAEFLGIRTLTVSIYSTWINRSSLPGAAQIALLMLAVILLLVMVERWARRHRHYASGARQTRRFAPRRIQGSAAILAFGIGLLPVLLGFGVPVAYLVWETIKRVRFAGISNLIFAEIGNTVLLAVLATAVVMTLSVLMAYVNRAGHRPITRLLTGIACVGYAVPGTVLALGLLSPLAGFDNALDALARQTFGISTGLLLSGSGFALIYAYAVRFLTIGIGGVESGFSKIPLALDDAARTLAASKGRLAWQVHVPLLQPALRAATLLVFVDCMKELPVTLLLRPLNFDTLATHLYAEASRGTYEEGAIAALLIVLVGLLPVILLAKNRTEA
jgi:iron(III) transport system permease protein